MQITEKVLDGLKRDLEVLVPYEEIDSRVVEHLQRLSKRVRVPGFRPGKIPIPHLRLRYGKSVIVDVVKEILEQSSQAVLQERNERPAFKPSFSLISPESGVEDLLDGRNALVYSMRFEVIPHVEIKDFSNLQLNRPFSTVSEEDIDSQIENLAQSNKPFVPVTKKRGAKNGDKLIVDFQGTIEGESFDGGSATDTEIVIGSGSCVPGFEDQLLGAKVGDNLVVKITFPANHSQKNLAGKPAEFSVNVKSLLSLDKALSGEELAKALGFGSTEQMREKIKEQLTEELQQFSRYKLKRALLDALDEQYSFDVPETLLQNELQSILQHIQSQEGTVASEGPQQPEEAYAPIANRRVRLGFVLSRIGELNGVKVSDEELGAALRGQASQFSVKEEVVYDYYRKNPEALAQLQAPIFEEKVVDYILSQVEVTDVLVSKEELLQDPDEPPVESRTEAPKGAATEKKTQRAKKSETAATKTSSKEKKVTKATTEEKPENAEKGKKKPAANSGATKIPSKKSSSQKVPKKSVDQNSDSPSGRRKSVSIGEKG